MACQRGPAASPSNWRGRIVPGGRLLGRTLEHDGVEDFLKLGLRCFGGGGIGQCGKGDALTARLEDPNLDQLIRTVEPPIPVWSVLPQIELLAGQRRWERKLDVRCRAPGDRLLDGFGR